MTSACISRTEHTEHNTMLTMESVFIFWNSTVGYHYDYADGNNCKVY